MSPQFIILQPPNSSLKNYDHFNDYFCLKFSTFFPSPMATVELLPPRSVTTPSPRLACLLPNPNSMLRSRIPCWFCDQCWSLWKRFRFISSAPTRREDETRWWFSCGGILRGVFRNLRIIYLFYFASNDFSLGKWIIFNLNCDGSGEGFGDGRSSSGAALFS